MMSRRHKPLWPARFRAKGKDQQLENRGKRCAFAVSIFLPLESNVCRTTGDGILCESLLSVGYTTTGRGHFSTLACGPVLAKPKFGEVSPAVRGGIAKLFLQLLIYEKEQNVLKIITLIWCAITLKVSQVACERTAGTAPRLLLHAAVMDTIGKKKRK